MVAAKARPTTARVSPRLAVSKAQQQAKGGASKKLTTQRIVQGDWKSYFSHKPVRIVLGDWKGYWAVKPKRIVSGDWGGYFHRKPVRIVQGDWKGYFAARP